MPPLSTAGSGVKPCAETCESDLCNLASRDLLACEYRAVLTTKRYMAASYTAFTLFPKMKDAASNTEERVNHMEPMSTPKM